VSGGFSVRSLVLRISEAGLIVAIWAAVLAFGGTSPPFFLVTQVIILGLGILLVSASLRTPLTTIGFPVAVPAALIGWVVLQIVPLPAFLAPSNASLHSASSGGVTLSFAPYQTVSHLILLVTYLTAFYLVLLIGADRSAKKRLVYALVALGGGDGPEAQIDVLDAALRSSWRRDAKRIVILITDSPPHGIGEPGDVVPASHPGGEQTTSSRPSLMLTLRQP